MSWFMDIHGVSRLVSNIAQCSGTLSSSTELIPAQSEIAQAEGQYDLR